MFVTSKQFFGSSSSFTWNLCSMNNGVQKMGKRNPPPPCIIISAGLAHEILSYHKTQNIQALGNCSNAVNIIIA